MDLYHISLFPIDTGEIIKPYSFLQRQYRYVDLVNIALQSSNPETIRSLFLNDELISIRTNSPSNFASAFIEVVFENVRKTYFKDVPSRYKCSFLFDSLEVVHRFKNVYRHPGIIHKCELVNGEVYKRDMTLVNNSIDLTKDPFQELEKLKQRAVTYWEGNAPYDFPETLLYGTAKVTEIIQ